MKRRKPSRLAIVDHLTGLYNRRYFDKRLKKIISESKKKTKHFSLLMIDIDKFKDVNDKYGHLVGDKVLNDLARVLKQSVRRPDICFRYGGDEVAVLLPNTERKAAENVVARLKYKVEKHRFSTEGSSKLRLKLSVGLAVFPEDGLKPKELIKQADALLYRVKARKKPKRRITEPFILETKLVPPALKENTIARPRLLSSLKENLDKKLVLVIADAGYGKTTLASQFLYQEKLPCVFYNLDANDQDLAVFLLHLIEAMQKIQKGLGKRTKTLLSHLGNITKNIEMIMGTLINEIVKKRKENLFIILDDFHTIPQESLIYQALDYFIGHLPDRVHIIISTRIAPPLSSLARWRSKQDVFELTKEELRFTDKEIKLLLKDIYKTTLSSEELNRLALHTEGWITGLQMILQHTGGEKIKNTINNYLESNVSLFEYFANEILKKESEVMQEFLLKSSILDWLMPDVCDTICEIKNSKKLLQSLSRYNLFTTLVSLHPPTYRYHHLFREFLRLKLAETISQKELHNLHAKSARFYVKKKNWDQAIYHLIKAGVYERAARIIEKVGDDFIRAGRTSILYHLIESLSQDTVNTQPWLLFYEACILRHWGKWDESIALHKRAQRIFHRRGDRDGEAETLCDMSTIYCRRGSHKKAIILAERALKLIGNKNNRLKVKLLDTLAGRYYYLGNCKLAEAKLNKALSLCRRFRYAKFTVTIKGNLAALYIYLGKIVQALKIYHNLHKSNVLDSPTVVIHYCNIAAIYMTMGEFESARPFLEKALQFSKQINFKRGQIATLSITGNLYRMTGEYENAFNFYNQALVLNKDMKMEYINCRVWSGMAQYYLAKGELNKAEEYINNCLTIEKVKTEKAILYLTLGEIKLRSGDHEKAEDIISRSHRILLRKGFAYQKMMSYSRLTDLYWTKGAFSKMRIYLKKAITIAKQQQYDGLLIFELNKNPRLIELAKDENIESEYLSKSMKKIGHKGYLEVWMLGAFRVKINDNDISQGKWKNERARSVFAYFLTKRVKVISRDQLLNIFFPDLALQKAGHKLRTSLFFIRKKLGARDFILYGNRSYRINPKVKCWTDMDEFLQIIKIGERYEKEGEKAEATTQYLRAVEIYKGDFLEDFYDNWCEEPREYYRSLYLKILKILADYCYNQGNYEQSIEYYRKTVQKDKYIEEAYCGIMRGYAKLGNRKEIIRQFQSLSKILQEELGCEPLPETKKLYKFLIKHNCQ